MRMGKSPLWPHSPVGWLRAGMMSMLEEWSGRHPVGVAGHWVVSKTSSRSPSCLSTCRSLEGFMAVTQGPRTPQQSYSQLPFTPAQAMLLSTGTSALCAPFPQCTVLRCVPVCPLAPSHSSFCLFRPRTPVSRCLPSALFLKPCPLVYTLLAHIPSPAHPLGSSAPVPLVLLCTCPSSCLSQQQHCHLCPRSV